MRLPMSGLFRKPAPVREQPSEPVSDDKGVLCGHIMVGREKVYYRAKGMMGKPTVLLLHGASFTSLHWEEIGTLGLIAEAGFRAIAVDMPGHGFSKPALVPSDHWLRELMKAFELERPVVVSPSMSGLFSFPPLVSHSSLFAGFVAIAPVRIRDFASRFGAVHCPVLAVWGENDQTIPREQAQLMRAKMHDCQVEIISDAGHACYIKQPEEFHEILIPFVADVVSRPKRGSHDTSESGDSQDSRTSRDTSW